MTCRKSLRRIENAVGFSLTLSTSARGFLSSSCDDAGSIDLAGGYHNQQKELLLPCYTAPFIHPASSQMISKAIELLERARERKAGHQSNSSIREESFVLVQPSRWQLVEECQLSVNNLYVDPLWKTDDARVVIDIQTAASCGSGCRFDIEKMSTREENAFHPKKRNLRGRSNYGEKAGEVCLWA